MPEFTSYLPWFNCAEIVLCCIFLLNELQLVVKHKCRRLLSNVTLDRHDLDLSSFPLEVQPV